MNETEEALAAALAQTGFPFEHHIFERATKHGWTTIPSRLYVDAEEEKTREMDLLCYRAVRGPEVMVYTAMLISCKARNDRPWVLMTRPWPKQRPPWYSYPPVAYWTNVAALQHELSAPNWGEAYFDEAGESGLHVWSADSREEVFALQELEAGKAGRFSAKGDSGLYGGVMSLLKALAYEVSSLDGRRGQETERLVYHFNLIQVLDGDLYEASFATGQPVVSPVQRYRYFARTMLNGKEFSSRIDFCTKDAFPEVLADMLKVHKFNVAHFNRKTKEFFGGVLASPARLNLFRGELAGRLASTISLHEGGKTPAADWLVDVEYDAVERYVILRVDLFSSLDVDRLNANGWVMESVKRLLKELYRYEGAVRFGDELPF